MSLTRSERFQYHLVKCQKNHAQVTLAICPYNATHHVPREEDQYHISNCPDLKIVELAKYSWLTDKPRQHGNLAMPAPNSCDIPVDGSEELEAEGVAAKAPVLGNLEKATKTKTN